MLSLIHFIVGLGHKFLTISYGPSGTDNTLALGLHKILQAVISKPRLGRFLPGDVLHFVL